MSTSFASALNAARDAAGAQHYPQGALYVVATPIGNLSDITLRALHVLQIADTIACEDTRHTQQMLRAYGLDKSGGQLLAVHQHNEAERATQVIDLLRQGKRVAYVSDAGTPGVSDPGARLCAAVQAAGLRSIPLPGASSVTTAISVAGIVSPDAQGFLFAGFLPTKASERASVIDTLALEPRAVVLLEAPHRIEEVARALAVLGERPVTLAREISKQFEQITTHPASALHAWLKSDSQHSRGEFVVVIHPAAPQADADDPKERQILQWLLAELPMKTAVRLTAQITGGARNRIYDMALALKDAPHESGAGDEA
ncbi:16S rRNA (cytidine(1402)-2'-O)-methyltransferase [Diaphorobacter aerolatus]|uniref:Ribosomal RNA small subunit methyltransferase I n=1 Tax=Diaphorobacter aerolatus TaxID=1288495 RepID=A0A7H0GP86_9BURK|nr:16S rRNA (cytidine(1402)-2'-O)-methyltransferase [Diaphorobacter aerolatus]QNP50102.1 16S rRNA (cytidine(1402)-2'-O)-methyltransferase [Diaphorobacter aerolatus]